MYIAQLFIQPIMRFKAVISKTSRNLPDYKDVWDA
jgi:hypothetical protein